jgi:hypothetical protein
MHKIQFRVRLVATGFRFGAGNVNIFRGKFNFKAKVKLW